jgi:DNA-directed RNA polymerase
MCSGLQHLAAIMRDLQLASEVNLIPQDDNTKVADVYTKVTKPINEEIRQFGRENLLYSNLSEVDGLRKDYKPSLMTTSYNVTLRGIINQLKSQFPTIKKDKDDKNVYYSLPSIRKNKTVTISEMELKKK